MGRIRQCDELLATLVIAGILFLVFMFGGCNFPGKDSCSQTEAGGFVSVASRLAGTKSVLVVPVTGAAAEEKASEPAEDVAVDIKAAAFPEVELAPQDDRCAPGCKCEKPCACLAGPIKACYCGETRQVVHEDVREVPEEKVSQVKFSHAPAPAPARPRVRMYTAAEAASLGMVLYRDSYGRFYYDYPPANAYKPVQSTGTSTMRRGGLFGRRSYCTGPGCN